MIDDDDIEKALDWLRDEAQAIAAAKERLVKAGHMVKHIKALEMKKWNEQTISAQEREALASQRYLDALMEEARAAGAYEEMKALREACALKIQSWQTMSANYRAMKI
jgi:hypothetical protein